MIYHSDILILPGSLDTEKQGHTSEKLLEILASVALDHVEPLELINEIDQFIDVSKANVNIKAL